MEQFESHHKINQELFFYGDQMTATFVLPKGTLWQWRMACTL
jgi:hypothetical protein